MSHVNAVDRSILRTAVAELVYVGTGHFHVIPERAGLAREYSTERSVGFAMGVLNRIADVRACELASGCELSESEEAGGQEANWPIGTRALLRLGSPRTIAIDGTCLGSDSLNPSCEAGKRAFMINKARVRVVPDANDIERSLKRIAHEILQRNKGAENLVLLGIPTRRVSLARRLRDALREAGGVEVPTGLLDITMYRDNLRSSPIRAPHPTSIPDGGIDAATAVLVDDVFYSNRTIRSALEVIADIGRPTTVQLAVLVDYGHRGLSIRVDYVGKNLPTSRTEEVRVNLVPIDEVGSIVTEEA